MNKSSKTVIYVVNAGLALLILLPAYRAEGVSSNELKLLELARNKFDTLTVAEEKLFKEVVNGEIADYSDKSEENNDPNNAKEWDKDTRSIRAEIVAWLCTDKEASSMATYKGLWIKGACIDGELDLKKTKISFPLSFEKSAFPKGISLSKAIISMLSLEGTYTNSINANDLKVEGDIYLRDGFKAEGEVNLIGATIRGNFECDNSQFTNEGGVALNADALKVDGSIFLRDGFKAEGEVCLTYTIVAGTLDCSNGEFINKDGMAINIAGSKVDGGVYFRASSKVEGEFCLVNATLGGNLECDNSQFTNKDGITINAPGLKVDGSVYFREGFKAEGEVNLIGATLDGDLDCSNSKFLNKNKDAISARGIKVGGNIYLCEGFQANGEVNIIGATLDGDLDCNSGQFVNPDGYALVASLLDIKKCAYFNNGFRAEGEVNLISTVIDGTLDCTTGMFINPKGRAISASNLNVKGNAYFQSGFKAEGIVDLAGATIDKYFIWNDVNSPKKTILDLRFAKVGILWDNVNSWPDQNNLYLQHFEYMTICYSAPIDARTRIDWLHRQTTFHSQTYEKLAKVLFNNGQNEDAKKVLIAKNEDRARLTKLTWSEKCWYRLFGPMIGFGYRPLNVFWGVAFFIILGSYFFKKGYRIGLIVSTTESAHVTKSVNAVNDDTEMQELTDIYLKFNSLMYSLDMFVPLIDLHQAKYWLPNTSRRIELMNIKGFSLDTGSTLRLYLWVHIIMGWTLTTLLVVGLTGLVRT